MLQLKDDLGIRSFFLYVVHIGVFPNPTNAVNVFAHMCEHTGT